MYNCIIDICLILVAVFSSAKVEFPSNFIWKKNKGQKAGTDPIFPPPQSA